MKELCWFLHVGSKEYQQRFHKLAQFLTVEGICIAMQQGISKPR